MVDINLLMFNYLLLIFNDLSRVFEIKYFFVVKFIFYYLICVEV